MRFTQAYQAEVVKKILYQILVINIQGNVQKLEGRINSQIMGVKKVNT